MSDLGVSRASLAAFIKDARTLSAFEDLLRSAGQINPDTQQVITVDTAGATAAANLAGAEAEELQRQFKKFIQQQSAQPVTVADPENVNAKRVKAKTLQIKTVSVDTGGGLMLRLYGIEGAAVLSVNLDATGTPDDPSREAWRVIMAESFQIFTMEAGGTLGQVVEIDTDGNLLIAGAITENATF